MHVRTFLGVLLLAGWAASPASAIETVTDAFDVSITIQPACNITADSDLSFGTQSYLNETHEAEVSVDIQCTNGTTGRISLDDGTGGGSVIARTMEYQGNSIEYSLYTNSDYTTHWGDGTSGSSTVDHIGTGAATALTIYGRTPVQGEPPAGTYSDTVTITVSY
jgi:spore coat protein U-like protein